AYESGFGGGVDDVTFVLLQKEWDERVHAVHDAVEVHAQHPVPDLLGRADGRAARDTGVVEDHVYGAELFQRGVAQCLDVGLLGDVAVHADDGGAVTTHLVDLCGQRCVLDVAEHDVRTGLRELDGGGEADAAGPSGDHGCLALQFHRSSSLVVVVTTRR